MNYFSSDADMFHRKECEHMKLMTVHGYGGNLFGLYGTDAMGSITNKNGTPQSVGTTKSKVQ